MPFYTSITFAQQSLQAASTNVKIHFYKNTHNENIFFDLTWMMKMYTFPRKIYKCTFEYSILTLDKKKKLFDTKRKHLDHTHGNQNFAPAVITPKDRVRLSAKSRVWNEPWSYYYWNIIFNFSLTSSVWWLEVWECYG